MPLDSPCVEVNAMQRTWVRARCDINSKIRVIFTHQVRDFEYVLNFGQPLLEANIFNIPLVMLTNPCRHEGKSSETRRLSLFSRMLTGYSGMNVFHILFCFCYLLYHANHAVRVQGY